MTMQRTETHLFAVAACVLLGAACAPPVVRPDAAKAEALKKDAGQTRSMAPGLCTRGADLMGKTGLEICLIGPVGVGKRGLFMAVENVAVYIDDHRDESLTKEYPELAQSALRKREWRVTGVLHYTMRQDFRTGLGAPMQDHYWLEVNSAEILRE